jgi:cytoskeletal protein CcmA (bactofilin family)
MADGTTVISRGAQVRGKLTGEGDLEIHGRVDGDVKLDGMVTVEAGGLVASDVSAAKIVVRGAVKGDLTAVESIALEDGARVVGDVRAPRVSIQAGALVRGLLQTGDGSPAVGRATARATESRPAKDARPAPKATAVPPTPRTALEVTASPTQRGAGTNGAPSRQATGPGVPAAASRARVEPQQQPSRAVTVAGGAAPAARHGPPPPVVPALKKGAKGALKKKA